MTLPSHVQSLRSCRGKPPSGSLFLGVSRVGGFQVLSTMELSFSGLFISQTWLPACSATFWEGDLMCLPFLPTALPTAFSPNSEKRELTKV